MRTYRVNHSHTHLLDCSPVLYRKAFNVARMSSLMCSWNNRIKFKMCQWWEKFPSPTFKVFLWLTWPWTYTKDLLLKKKKPKLYYCIIVKDESFRASNCVLFSSPCFFFSGMHLLHQQITTPCKFIVVQK